MTDTPTFPDLMASRQPPLRNTDVARATGYHQSQTFSVLNGRRLVHETGYRNMPSELSLLAQVFDRSPDQIRKISQATVAWQLKQAMERTIPCATSTEESTLKTEPSKAEE